MSASTENVNLGAEIIKSQAHIFKAHSLHFHALSILFLLPLFFALAAYPTFHLALFHPHFDFTPRSNYEYIVPLAFALFADLLFLCGTAAITYSTVQAFYDRPVNLVSSIKSIRNSFSPLFSTVFVSQAISVLTALLLITAFVILVKILKALGLYQSDHFFIWIFVGVIVFTLIMLWLRADWSLACAVAVVESKSGFGSIRRSSCLVKGKKGVASTIILVDENVMIGMVIGGSVLIAIFVGAMMDDRVGWWILAITLPIVYSSVMSYRMMERSIMTKVVMYLYYKDLSGENLPIEVKFANDYVSLPLEDDLNNDAIV